MVSAILPGVRPLAAVLLLACLALVACDSGDEPKSVEIDASRLAGAPAPLAKLHSQSNELLAGGREGFEQRLKQLRGYPVVVNKWASWCGPCRFEFPFFQRQAVKRAKEVAFVGVNSDDNDGDAKEFLRDYPVPFPSYEDPRLEVAAVFNGVQAFPTTAFYDSTGELAFVHQGNYATEAKLAEDIEQYAR
jgi:cytochrome c biogenesis protein CcmG/thiol:disulfide interchange protein DsbE